MSSYVGQLDAARFVRPKAIAGYGFALGVVAFVAVIPPIAARSPVVPALLGILAAFAGVFAASRGARRAGWGAVVVGLLGVGLGVLATRSSTADLNQVFTASLIASMLVFATPLTYAAIGGMLSERSGGREHRSRGHDVDGGVLGHLGRRQDGQLGRRARDRDHSGGLFALVHAFFAIHLRADQIVGGVAVNFLALGITGYFFVQLYHGNNVPPGVSQIPDVNLTSNSNHGFFSDAFGHLNLMILGAMALVVVSYFVMFRTPLGLRIRACGEHPRAADTVGINVYLLRYFSVILSGMLAAAGGAFLTVGYLGTYNENVTVGRGFIALAASSSGTGGPSEHLGAALLFGALDGDRLPPARLVGATAATLFQALPDVIHVDRRRGRDRLFDSTRSRWPP